MLATRRWSCARSRADLEQYSTSHTCRHLNQNSGVIVYARNNIADVSVYEPNICDADSLVVKIGKDYAFICVYRSPSFFSIANFLASLDELMTNLEHIPNIYMLGDFNIDIGNASADIRSDDYLDLLAIHGLMPSHTFPTRLEKCYDHCFVKSKSKVITAICRSCVTDHRCLYLVIPLSRSLLRTQKSCSKINYNKAVDLISKVNWDGFLTEEDANKLTENFVNTIHCVVKSCTQIVSIPNRKQTFHPWITPGLLRCMRFRDTLHRRYQKSPKDKDLEFTYKRYRNHCNNILHNLKNRHDRCELEDAKLDIKKTWKVIKRVCGLNNKTETSSELLKPEQTHHESGNIVNNYFANVGENLAANILQNLNLTQDALVQKYTPENTQLNSFMLLETDEIEVNKVVASLKSTSSSGWDGISSYLLKKCIGVLVTPITYLCNLCFSSGVFPKPLKESVVIPIFKSGDRDSITNYRPISLLPTLAKVLEKLINIRLVKYLEANNLLSHNQYGFRGRRSTSDAIDTVVTHLVNNLDRKQKSIAVFLDLAKAFDTVSVPLLLRKLESVGVRGVPLDLFKDYLHDRYQTVRLGNSYSSKQSVNYGVPQGSVLGPTLFLVYLNDLCNTKLPNAKITSFADDTAIIFSGSSWEDARTTAESGMRLIINWLNNNLLTLNLSKTKYMTFSIYNNYQPNPGFSLKVHTCSSDNNLCRCYTLSATDCIKYLGVTIDKNLNWKSQIDTLKTRIRKLIHIFKKIRYLKDEQTNKTVYLTLCQSILTYGISAWGGAAKTILIKLERTQRSILKVLYFKPFRYPTFDLYKESKVLTVRKLFIKLITIKQHAFPTHYVNRRRTHEVYRVPLCNTRFAQSFAYFLGPFLYNRISKIVTLKDNTRYICGNIIEEFLNSLDYEGTETLLQILR